MNFDDWYCKHGENHFSSQRDIAEAAWNAASEQREAEKGRLRTMMQKMHQRMRAYRDAMKRMMTVGCRRTGRCKSRRVNENYCPVCRPGMNALYEFEPTPEEVLKALLAPECPECRGLGTIPPDFSGHPAETGLPDIECPKCKGHGSLYDDGD
jgi:rubrerythrin